jgi:pantoate--beta-alanine ligase
VTCVVHTRAELAAERARLAERAGPVAVVMTMGALHAGHAELIRTARKRAASVIVTVFLNPLQFAPGEDLAKYPRTLPADVVLCEEEGVDVVFAPSAEVVYRDGEPLVTVSAGAVGDLLEGDSRPGHFDGVLTVVAKLLGMVAPDLAYFGQKDAQQLWLISRMVRDLDLPVEVVSVPTVRDDDGLALSSRNTYLSPADHEAALALSRALDAGRSVAAGGASAVLEAAGSVLAGEPDVRVDYLALVDPLTFAPLVPNGSEAGEALLVVAAFVGTTRLIDNTTVRLLGPSEEG